MLSANVYMGSCQSAYANLVAHIASIAGFQVLPPLAPDAHLCKAAWSTLSFGFIPPPEWRGAHDLWL